MTQSTSATWNVFPYRQEVYHPDFSDVVADAIYRHCHATFASRVKAAFDAIELEEHEERPSDAAVSSIVSLIDKASRTESLFEPQVSVFYGEASATWKLGKREVSLLSRGNADDPKLLKYEARENGPGHHSMQPRATEKDLRKAIGYSKKHGWLYDE